VTVWGALRHLGAAVPDLLFSTAPFADFKKSGIPTPSHMNLKKIDHLSFSRILQMNYIIFGIDQ
jgi:hypothetical protein